MNQNSVDFLQISTVKFPILIGITGKRNLMPTQIGSISERLRLLFTKLDTDFPNVPKVLLTGGAYGADMIAAEIILENSAQNAKKFLNWSVVFLLPFDQDLFEKDFRPEDLKNPDQVALADEHLRRLRAMLSAQDRIVVRQLPPLHCNDQKNITTREDIDKDLPSSNAILRREHYEQVGQFITESANILIAVMDAQESADRSQANGGTARIVDCRCRGYPDHLGRDVARRSSVLRGHWPTLVDRPSGRVWLIEPEIKAETDGYPVSMLFFPKYGDIHQATPAGISVAHGTGAVPQLRADLVIAKAFRRLNREADRQEARARSAETQSHQGPWSVATSWISSLGSRPGPSRPLICRLSDPTAAIGDVRKCLSQLQGSAKEKADTCFKAIAILFILAILFLEIFDKFQPENKWILLIYVMLLCFIFSIVITAKMLRWQSQSEDYRAANEMLRIQRVWWAAGMPNRVDHEHLQSVGAELARIRDGVRAIVSWIWLLSDWPSAQPPVADWAYIRGTEPNPRHTEALSREKKSPPDWIGSQIWYFARNFENLHRKVGRFDAVSSALLASSAWLAALLCLGLSIGFFVGDADHHADTHVSWPAFAAGMGSAVAAAAAFALTLRWWALRPTRRHGGLGDRAKIWQLPWPTAAIGLVLALFCSVIALGGGWAMSAMAALHPAEHQARHLMILLFVTLSAAAGAVRFVAEKLNFEAQALAYRDVLGCFERAEQLLAQDVGDAGERAGERAGAEQVVHDLAILAMRENEAWLKARRERPLSPMT